MCGKHEHFSRATFLAAAGAAAALPAAAAASAAPPLLSVPHGLRSANARAASIAAASPLVRANYGQVHAFVQSIGDARLRAHVQDLLERPSPRYALRYRTPESRSELRDQLVREGLLAAQTAVEIIFPPGTDGSQPVQPFWSTPGSDFNGHHSYPGGLMAHELFNATAAANFGHTYDTIDFANRRTVDRDLVIAAAFYHDVMKTVVFQYNDDGTLLAEGQIAATGAHHCLSGAEAIVRGRDARFVTALLSAHAAPSLGDETKVVQWCRASAIIAGVDPVEYGLVAQRGGEYVLAALPSIESFVSFLSDHDFVLTIPAVRAVVPEIAKVDPSAWFRHEMFAKHSATSLYEALRKNKLAETLRG